MFISWWRNWIGRKGQSAARDRRSARPRLEALEDRLCPSLSTTTLEAVGDGDQFFVPQGRAVQFTITGETGIPGPIFITSSGGLDVTVAPGESFSGSYVPSVAHDTFHCANADGALGVAGDVQFTAADDLVGNVYGDRLIIAEQPIPGPPDARAYDPFFPSHPGTDGFAFDTVTVSLGNNPEGATLSGTLTYQFDHGFTFLENLIIDKPGQGYTLVFTSEDGVVSTSQPFDVQPPDPTYSLAFIQQPPNGQLRKPLPAPVKVQVNQINGQRDTGYDGSVTLSLGDNATGAELSGTLTAPVVNGVATFKNLTVNKAGEYTLVATLGFSITATSNRFTIGPTLAVTKQPPDKALTGNPIRVTIAAQLPSGKIDKQFNAPVTLDLEQDGIATDTSVTVNAVKGVAKFVLTVDESGDSYTAVASSTGTASVTTEEFDVADVITLTWTGGGDTPNWSDTANWQDEEEPGEWNSGLGLHLVFPAGVVQTTTMNDVADLTVGSIAVGQSYAIKGAGIDLAGEVSVLGGDTTFDLPITLGEDADPVFAARAAASEGDAAGASVTIKVDQLEDSITLDRVLNGSLGLIKTGPGELVLDHANTFTGDTQLEEGSLKIEDRKALGTGTLIIAPNEGSGNMVTLRPLGGSKLSNPLSLRGGTLAVAGQMTLTGAVTVANDTTVRTDATTSSLKLNGEVRGPGTMTVEGAGKVVLNGTLSTGVSAGSSVPFFGEFPGIVWFGSDLTGNGSVTVDGGGTLRSDASNRFAGSINLDQGTIEVSVAGALGSAALTVRPVGQNVVTLDPLNENFALGNALTLQGGTLTVAPGRLTLSSGLTVQQSSEIAPAERAFLTLEGEIGGASAATLTVGGQGQVHLAGVLTTSVIVKGQAQLDRTFGRPAVAVPGSLTVDGGQLGSAHLVAFAGKITLKSGTIFASADNALGHGELVVNASGQTALLDASGASVTLDNTLNLASDTLHIKGGVTFRNTVLAQQTAGIAPADGSNVRLFGDVKGPLTMSGDGQLSLKGTLQGSVTILSGTVKLLANFDSVSGNDRVIVDGGTLSSTQALNRYSGAIALQQGTIQVRGKRALGLGNLDLGSAGTAVSIEVLAANVTLGNIGVTFTGGTVNLLGGKLNFDPGTADLHTVAVMAANTALNLSTGTSLDLPAGLSGAQTLTVTGTGSLGLGGQVSQTRVVVPSRKQFLKLSGFSLTNGAIVVDANGNPIP